MDGLETRQWIEIFVGLALGLTVAAVIVRVGLHVPDPTVQDRAAETLEPIELTAPAKRHNAEVRPLRPGSAPLGAQAPRGMLL